MQDLLHNGSGYKDPTAYKALKSLKGERNRADGAQWEEIIKAACRYYSDREIAEISKTPEPMAPIRSLGRGRFEAYYKKKAQPDFKGTLKGGKAVVFEAKHTNSDRIQRSVISDEQEKQLNKHARLGAECFIMVSFGFERYFKIPWAVFRDMRQHFGRKYIMPNDVKQYEIKFSSGVLKFL